MNSEENDFKLYVPTNVKTRLNFLMVLEYQN